MKFIPLLLVLSIGCLSVNAFADNYDAFQAMVDRYYGPDEAITERDTFCNYAKTQNQWVQTIQAIFEKLLEEVLYPHNYNKFLFFYKIDVSAQEYFQLMCTNSNLAINSSKALSYKEKEITLRAIETQLFYEISENDVEYFKELHDTDYSKRVEAFLHIATLKQKTLAALRSTDQKKLCLTDKHIAVSRFFLQQTDLPHFVESDKVFIEDTDNLYRKLHPVIKAACKGMDVGNSLQTQFTEARDIYIKKYPKSAEARALEHYANVNAQFNTSYSLVIGYTYPSHDNDKNGKKK